MDVSKTLIGLILTVALVVLMGTIVGSFVPESSAVSSTTPDVAVAAQNDVPPQAPIQFPEVVTVGNRSYVPVNLSGTPMYNARTILEAIALFETVRKVVVTDFKFETNESGTHVYGLWLTHEPR